MRMKEQPGWLDSNLRDYDRYPDLAAKEPPTFHSTAVPPELSREKNLLRKVQEPGSCPPAFLLVFGHDKRGKRER